ncbi:MAG TPA: DUF1499 domain-containing protein [Usitatibacteraceae bacterium]
MKIAMPLKRIALGLFAIAALIGALIAIEYSGGHPMGLFSGSRPDGLGFNNGQFKAPPWKPNCVSSTVDKSDTKHYIAPLAFSGDAASAWLKLVGTVKAQPNTAVIKEQPDYLYAEFKSAGLGFVDDVEFALDAKAGVVQVRSASRLGIRDFGVNRKRIENLRAQFRG